MIFVGEEFLCVSQNRYEPQRGEKITAQGEALGIHYTNTKSPEGAQYFVQYVAPSGLIPVHNEYPRLRPGLLSFRPLGLMHSTKCSAPARTLVHLSRRFCLPPSEPTRKL